MIAIRNEAVYQPRFQGLGPLSLRTRFTFEYQAGIQAPIRQRARRCARQAKPRILQTVLSEVVADGRLEEVTRAAARPAYFRRQVQSHARGADPAQKIDGFTVEQEFESAVVDRVQRARLHPRNPGVRAIRSVHGGVDGLEVLQLPANAPRIVVVQHLRAAFQESYAGLLRSHGEALEVIGVAYAGDVRIKTQAMLDVGDVGVAHIAAIVVLLLVVGQKCRVELAMRTRRQITEILRQLHAARRQQAGRDGQVVVRREVEVVGHFCIEAVAAGVAEARE